MFCFDFKTCTHILNTFKAISKQYSYIKLLCTIAVVNKFKYHHQNTQSNMFAAYKPIFKLMIVFSVTHKYCHVNCCLQIWGKSVTHKYSRIVLMVSIKTILTTVYYNVWETHASDLDTYLYPKRNNFLLSELNVGNNQNTLYVSFLM